MIHYECVETFSIRYGKEHIEIEYQQGKGQFTWRFSNTRVFESINTFFNSKNDIDLKAGYLIERSIIHE